MAETIMPSFSEQDSLDTLNDKLSDWKIYTKADDFGGSITSTSTLLDILNAMKSPSVLFMAPGNGGFGSVSTLGAKCNGTIVIYKWSPSRHIGFNMYGTASNATSHEGWYFRAYQSGDNGYDAIIWSNMNLEGVSKTDISFSHERFSTTSNPNWYFVCGKVVTVCLKILCSSTLTDTVKSLLPIPKDKIQFGLFEDNGPGTMGAQILNETNDRGSLFLYGGEVGKTYYCTVTYLAE